MINLLQETLRRMADLDYTIDDIVYIGTDNGLSCNFRTFSEMADVDYDNGTYTPQVLTNLYIVFTDGSYLERELPGYIGVERWVHVVPFKKPVGELWPLESVFHFWA